MQTLLIDLGVVAALAGTVVTLAIYVHRREVAQREVLERKLQESEELLREMSKKSRSREKRKGQHKE